MKNSKPSKTKGESRTHTHGTGSSSAGEAISSSVSTGETTGIIIPLEFAPATKGRKKRATSRKK